MGLDENDLLNECNDLLDLNNRSRIFQDYQGSIIWNYENLLGIAYNLCKEGLMDDATRMFALAFFFDPSNFIPELNIVASFHLMGENEVAFEKINQFIDKNPNLPFGYFLAGNISAAMKNFTSMELMLTKANLNKVKFPDIGIFAGLYLEEKGKPKEAISLYKKFSQDYADQVYGKLFEYLVTRISTEYWM